MHRLCNSIPPGRQKYWHEKCHLVWRMINAFRRLLRGRQNSLILAFLAASSLLKAHAADGFWILGPDLALTGQTNWFPYSGTDTAEPAFMGWIFPGATSTAGIVNLNRTLAPGTYYVMLKIIDYSGGGRVSVSGGNGSALVNPTNADWNAYWTTPVSFLAAQSFSSLSINLLKTIATAGSQQYLLRGLYITTNANENVPIYGEDRIVNWTYPATTNNTPPTPGNVLENGSFETGLGHGWGFLAEAYERQFTIGSLVDTNQAFHGTACVTFPVKGTLISRTYNLKPNSFYTLSAWVRSAAPSGVNFHIYNVATPPPGVQGVLDTTINFLTTTAWTRVSSTVFLPEYPDSSYQIGIIGWPGVSVDAVQLEQGISISPFQPKVNVEIGFNSDKPGRIFFEDENPSLTLMAFNNSNAPFSGTMAFEIYDSLNRMVKSGELPLTIPSAAPTTQSFTLPAVRGIFRLVAWIEDLNGSLEETVYAVVPRPRTTGIDEGSMVGVSPNFDSFELASIQRLGFHGGRAMSPAAIFRWSTIEPVEGQITWYDDQVNMATNYGVTIMGTIGSNNYWPPWADTNGLPDLNKWRTFVGQLVTHYSGRVRSWEIWNEPIYTFTPQFYAAMLTNAAAAIRSADPTAKIVAMGGSWDVNWILQVMAALGPNWAQDLDVIATHIYPPPSNEPSVGETDATALGFKNQIINAYGVQVWNTESGSYDQGFYKTANSCFYPKGEPMWPYLDSERYFQGCYYEAETAVINFLHCVGNGLTKYFYYDSRIYADPSYQRSHPSMLEYDDSIRSKGIAYAMAGRFLDGSRALGSVSPSTNTTYAYLFSGATNATVALWSKDRLNHLLSLTASGWNAFDMMGNPLPVTNSSIVVGRTPIYIQSSSLSSAALGAAFASATVTNASDTLAPNLSIDDFPIGHVNDDINFRWLAVDETSIPSPRNTNAVTYSYMLQGRDTSWSPWTPATHITYSGLQGGSYTFLVRAQDAAGNISLTNSRAFSTGILPPTGLHIVGR